MYIKKLIGSKCYLSPIDTNDYVKYAQWINDMEVSIGLILASKLMSLEKEKEILETLSKQDFNFAIVDLEKDELIGNIGFVKLDYVNRLGVIGIFIGNKDYWSKGYGSEAIELVLDFGFNILNLNSIRLTVYSYNEKAIACYKKVGFKEAGRLREARIIAGEKYDEIYIDILASEFKSKYVKKLVESKKLNNS